MSTVKLLPAEFAPAHVRIYEEAFPAEERRPAANRHPADPAFRFYNISTKEYPEAGLITTWDFGSFRYVEHFAIDKSLRGSGIGADAIDALGGTVLLEVEPPGTGEQALRRIEFYKRHGFHLLDYPYFQPPYSSELPGVELRLMLRGELEIPVEDAVRILHVRVYGQKH